MYNSQCITRKKKLSTHTPVRSFYVKEEEERKKFIIKKTSRLHIKVNKGKVENMFNIKKRK